MARTKQIVKKGSALGTHMLLATFPHAKLPCKVAASHRRCPGSINDPKVPVAVHLTRENAALRRRTTNATPQGFYKPPMGPTQSGKRRRYGQWALNEIRFYQKTYSLMIQVAIFMVDKGTLVWCKTKITGSILNPGNGSVCTAVGSWSIPHGFTRRCQPLCFAHQMMHPDALWHSVGEKTLWWERLRDINSFSVLSILEELRSINSSY